MTIKHNGSTVFAEKTVRAKGALFAWLSGEPGKAIGLRLLPDPDNVSRDTVVINTNHHVSREVTGRAINLNPVCQENGIRWSPFPFKER